VNDKRRFRCQPESVSAARRFVREVLRGHAPEVVDAAELMTSELASNCVRHAHTDFELVIRSRDQIRVEVRDTGRGRPELRSPTPVEPTGRGLRIVDAMSDTWGIAPSAAGKTVWFTLDASEVASPPSDASSALESDGGDRAVRSSGLRRMLRRRRRDPDPSMCSDCAPSRAGSRSAHLRPGRGRRPRHKDPAICDVRGGLGAPA
jgi:anti-sigma regulatory factor (Ser/Thr protein kinase)